MENLRFSYGSGDVLHDLSFAIRPGEVTGLLGPNGAGKSTLLRILAGILIAGEGTVLVNNCALPADAFALKKTLGYAPDTAELYESLTAAEFLEFCGRLHDLPERLLPERIESLLGGLGLLDEQHQRLGAYSKGMRQKVLLAAALLHNPSLVILDEPLTGLDADSVVLVKQLLIALAARGRTVLYSSHVLDVVERVCARVLILAKGTLIADGSPEELKARTRERTLEDVFRQVTHADDVAPRVTLMVDALGGP